MIQEVLENIAEAVLNAESNSEIFDIFFKNGHKNGITNELLERYSFIVCSNFEDSSNFSQTYLGELNNKTFHEKNNKEIFVKHYFYPYTNILFINKDKNTTPIIDQTIFLDSNAFKMFQDFYTENTSNELIDFKIRHNIDLNYLPYMLEDFVNPYHTRPNYEITREKVKIIETINNMDIEHYNKTNELIFDKKLLMNKGYSDSESYVDDKFFFFANFFEKKDMKSIKLQNSILQISDKKLDYHRFLLDYNLIFGYMLKILTEKLDSNSSIESKIINLYKDMLAHDRVMMQILHLAYEYFANPSNVNKFLKYDFTWSYDKVLATTYNITWDIFLYLFGKYFIINRERNDIKFDFGVPFYMTGDTRFWKSFVAEYGQTVFIIDNAQDQQNMVTIPIPTDTYIQITKILSEYQSNNYDKILRIRKKSKARFMSPKQIKSNHDKLLATSLIYKDTMMNILKYKICG